MAGSLFVDHATGFMFGAHQPTLGTSDTLTAKHRFEQQMRYYGVLVHT